MAEENHKNDLLIIEHLSLEPLLFDYLITSSQKGSIHPESYFIPFFLKKLKTVNLHLLRDIKVNASKSTATATLRAAGCVVPISAQRHRASLLHHLRADSRGSAPGGAEAELRRLVFPGRHPCI